MEQSPADPRNRPCFCCHPGRRLCCDFGQWSGFQRRFFSGTQSIGPVVNHRTFEDAVTMPLSLRLLALISRLSPWQRHRRTSRIRSRTLSISHARQHTTFSLQRRFVAILESCNHMFSCAFSNASRCRSFERPFAAALEIEKLTGRAGGATCVCESLLPNKSTC